MQTSEHVHWFHMALNMAADELIMLIMLIMLLVQIWVYESCGTQSPRPLERPWSRHWSPKKGAESRSVTHGQ